jgi:catechol 2,3-dioxygenase-like lactoylglutathione lyase family enzyme
MTTSTGMALRLELFVHNMDISIDFYCRVLGLELVRRETDYASLRSGNVVLAWTNLEAADARRVLHPCQAGQRSRRWR